MASVTAKKLIGKEYDIALFGQVSKEARKRDLKKRGLWKMREKKWDVKFVEATKDENKMKGYTATWETIEAIEGIEKIEEFEMDSKHLIFFIKEDAKIFDVLKAIEKLSFVSHITNAKKVEVR